MKNKLQLSALFIGFAVFVGVYAIGGMLVIFISSVLPANMNTETAMFFLRVGGYLALAFPAYVVARAVDENELLHALLMGVVEGIGIVLLMMNTFSFEGTLQQLVISRMLPVFAGVMLLSFIAGIVAKQVNKRDIKKRDIKKQIE